MKKIISFAIFFLLFITQNKAQSYVYGNGPGPQEINSPGDYYFVPPPGVTTFTVELYGAGGGGNPFTGWGGGGGAFSRGTFTFDLTKGYPYVFVHVGNGGTSAKNGESTIASQIAYSGKLVPYVIANGGAGAPSSLGNGVGGPASPQLSGVSNYFSNRGGNGSYRTNGYYGAGGGCADANGSYDAPTPSGSGCNTGGISGAAGSGGNGGGNGCSVSAGGFPGGGGGSGIGSGANGANGRIVIYWTCPTASDIGPSHTVPYPQEKNPDYLKDATGVSPTGNGLVYSWEQSRDGINNWVAAPSSTNDIKYALPEDSLLNYFRRVSNICNVTQYSNVVKINVVRKDTVNSLNPLGSYGSIQGRIISKGGNPVKGDSVLVRKKFDLLGSPKEFSYYDTTNGDGIFTVKKIFYGKQANLDGDPTDVQFLILPIKYGHVFSKYSADDTTNVSLNASNYDVETASTQGSWTFRDLTAVSVLGRTYQQCDGCIPQIAGQLVQRDLDSVSIKVNDLNSGLRSQRTIDDKYGRFNYTVEDLTQSYRFSPSYKNHKFDTTGNVIRTDRDTVLSLRDTTTYSISGTFRAGCNEIIGRATLQFSDIPQTPERNSVFFFNVTTQTNGNYIVRLPAGRYKVKVLSFVPSGSGADLQATNVTKFFSGDSVSSAINPDSLKVDISTTNATLNLTYQRPPTIQLVGWDSICKTVYGEAFDVWKQLDLKPLQVKVYQGPSTKGCPLPYDSVKIFTTVQTDGVEEIFKVGVDTSKASLGIAKDTLKVGVPNINGDYTKSLYITYVDRYGNPASLSRKIVVTGSRARPGQTFETVSPQIPLMVVHDPPGDQSYARWKQTSSSETAMRFYVNSAAGATIWTEAKVGAAFSAGVDIFGVSFSTDFAAWASVNASASITAKNSVQNELIVHTETSEEIKTSADNGGIGSSGDVFYGGALNLIYGTTDDILFSNCQVTKKSSAVFAPNKIMTTYRYTESDIKNTIANLRLLAQQTPSRADSFNNQANVWQQVLDNNNRNKANAAFVENKTFTGGGSSGETTISRSSTGTNTVEFGLEVDASLALELGLEVAGNGIKGGVIVNLQLEVGASFANSKTSSTEISYLLQDKDPGDKYTVNISRDPVYGTPVFKTLAGLSSCPPEENTIARDEMTIVTVGPSEINVPSPDKVTNFDLTIGNNSIDPGDKPYNLFVVDNDGAAVAAEGVSIGGTSLFYGIPPIPQGGTQNVNIVVTKRAGANSPFTYRNIKFIVADVCSNKLYEATVTKSQLVSVNFATTCSNLNMVEPSDGWVLTSANQNKLNFIFDGYTPSGLNTIVVQYRLTGSANWIDANSTTKTAADLAGSTSYTLDWLVADRVDGKYDIRMKLVCTSGIIYTKSVTGLIDRKAPSLFGIPDPTDGNYQTGDVISFSYDENIEVSTLNTGNKVQLYRMSNNTLIPSTASGIGNKIIITPGVNLLQYLGDSIKVVVSNIYDIYGNGTSQPDVSKFTIGTLPPVVLPAKPVKVYTVPVSMFENSTGSMQVRFKMDVLPKRPVVKVNFTIGGNAMFNNDYTVSIPTLKTIVRNPFTGVNEEVPLVSSFNGTQGYIYIDSNSQEAILTITPIKDTVFENDENIVINLTTGGDYSLSDSVSTIATIRNDDLQPPNIDSTGLLTFCSGGSVILTAVTPNIQTRWATSVIRKSGEYSSTLWGAKQALGAPDVYPLYGDIQYAWSPTNPDNAREFLELGFSNPAPINFINIFETYNPGSIDTVYVRDAANNWVRVYAENAMPSGDSSRILNITFPMTAFPVSAVRIAMNSAAVAGFNEIDAVGIGLDTTYNAYQWSTGETTKSIQVNTSGIYVCKVTNGVGQRAYSLPVKVTVIQPVATILGTKKACVGKTSLLTNTTPGGVWSSSDTTKAKISSTGLVTGVAAGTVVITYSTPANGFGCLNVTNTTFTVNALPTVAAIAGSNTVCIGSTITLTNATTGGIWRSSDTAKASISAAGVVTGKTVGTVTITYTTAANTNGCTNVASRLVTINALPTVNAITGINNVCVGKTTTLSNTTTGGTWSSSDTTKATVSINGVVTGKIAGTVNITYTTAANAGGCTNKTSLQVTMNALPVVAAIGGTKSVCIGSTTALSNTTTGGVWSCTPSTIATISSTGVVTGVAAGNATVSYTVTSASGCVRVVTTPVAVNALPVVGPINGTSNVCVGFTRTLTNATTGGTWSSSDTTKASISTTGVVTGKAAGTVTITYTTAANTNGCRNKSTLLFTVNPIPVLSAISGVKTICIGSTSQMDCTPAGGVWTCTPSNFATINNSGLVTGVAAGIATVTYTVTGVGGCVKSVATNATIRALPTVAPITGTPNVCVGNVTTLVNTTAGGTWSSSDVNIATISSSGIVIGVAAGNVTITYTTLPNANGCTNKATLLFTVNAPPVPNPITGSKMVCAGGATTTLSNSTAGGIWRSSDTAIATINSAGVVTGKVAGSCTIIYEITGTGGCKNSTTLAMSVKAQPAVSAVGGTRTVCVGKTTTLTCSPAGGTWSSSNTSLANVSNTGVVTGVAVGSPVITYTTPANVSGCTNKSSATVVVNPPCIAIPIAKAGKEISNTEVKPLDVQIYPNPTGNVFNLLIQSGKQETIDVRVMDITGKVAYLAKGKPGQVFRFGEKLMTGTYLIEVRQGDEVKTLKAVKIK